MKLLFFILLLFSFSFSQFANEYCIYYDADANDSLGVAEADDADFELGTADYTLNFWLKHDWNNGGTFYNSRNNLPRVYCFISSFHFQYRDVTVGTNVIAYSNPYDEAYNNIWTMLTVVGVRGDSVYIYINGVRDQDPLSLPTSARDATDLTSTLQPVRIGVNSAGLDHLVDSYMDEYSIWNDDLTPAEITAIYNDGVPIDLNTDSGNYASSADLIVWLRFENTGTNIENSATNATVSIPTTIPSDPYDPSFYSLSGESIYKAPATTDKGFKKYSGFTKFKR